MSYELGKQYEMRVVDMRVDSAGNDCVVLHDDDPSKEYSVRHFEMPIREPS